MPNRRLAILPLLMLLVPWMPLLASAAPEAEALWPFRVEVERGPDRKGKPQAPGSALAWLPAGQPLRGLIVAGSLGIEDELVIDPVVRAACSESGVGVVMFVPHLSGTFTFWREGNRDGERLLNALDGLARQSGRPDVARVPWITLGHSTAGIFCRNVAYWRPERVAAVLSFKSGNFFQKEHQPPTGSVIGVPLVAINGQVETFGPEGGIKPELGRETQWRAARDDLLRFRSQDPRHLMQMLIHPGQDHFHGGGEIVAFTAVFIRATAAHRLPATITPGQEPIPPRPLAPEDGWLSHADLVSPPVPAAPYATYAGDRASAMWHLDRSVAEATAALHSRLSKHQCLEAPSATWSDAGDGWEFTATARWLDRLPEAYGGALANLPVGHSPTPFVLQIKTNEPIVQLAPDRFRVLRPIKAINLMAWHPGDESFRSTGRWATIPVPVANNGLEQTITFPSPGDLPANQAPIALRATSSAGLPVHYEVDYGPLLIRDGLLRLALPPGAALPSDCRITAWQIGRRTGEPVKPAAPVRVTFRVVAP